MKAVRYGNEQQANAMIFDTAGRLQIDGDLVQELKKLHQTIQPDEVLLVGDSALGQRRSTWPATSTKKLALPVSF